MADREKLFQNQTALMWLLVVSVLIFQFSHFCEAGEEQDALMTAISASNVEIVKALLNDPIKLERIEINKKQDGWNPLSLAVVTGNSEVVKLLLNQGASLSKGVDHNGHEYSPFMLAAQSYGRAPDAFNVIQSLLEQFKSEDYKREIKSTFVLKQPNLRAQLEALHEYFLLRKSQGSSCGSTADPYLGDLKAQSYRAMEITCAICKEVPGDASKTRMLNGTFRTGASVKCKKCGDALCKQCLDDWISSKNVYGAQDNQKCPSCRTAIPMGNYEGQVEITHNWIPEFTQWEGGNKVPIPGQRAVSPGPETKALVSALGDPPRIQEEGPPALAQQPQLIQNQAPIQEFVEVPNRLEKLHKVYRIEGDPNAVWTEPLRVVRQPGLLDRMRGQVPTLTNTLVEMDYDDLMRIDRGCFALNPAAHRRAILQEVRQGRAPARGCYPPLTVDFERFRTARGWGTPVGYRLPGNIPEIRRWFRSASTDDAVYAFGFYGGSGGIGLDYRGSRETVMCRCVGAAW